MDIHKIKIKIKNKNKNKIIINKAQNSNKEAN